MIDSVPYHSNAIQFTAVGPVPGPATAWAGESGPDTPREAPLGIEELASLYGYDDPATPCLRLNFVSSIDGAVTVDGRSGGLGGPGDRALFMLLRRLADVIVVGAGTVRAENYGGARLDDAARAARVAQGLPPVPRIAVVTASGRLDPAHRVFHDTEVPPLVITSRRADPSRISAFERAGARTALLPPLPNGDADLAVLPDLLRGLGCTRILCEGGPSLAGRALAAGIVDEMCVTTAPMLIGGTARRIAAGQEAAPTPMRLRHLLTDGTGALYARWSAARSAAGPAATGYRTGMPRT